MPATSRLSPPLAPPPAGGRRCRPPRPRYFYFGRDYGSEALYGPLWVFVNRGYDVLQDHVAGRNIFTFDYRTNLGNVVRNFTHPFPAIAADVVDPVHQQCLYRLRPRNRCGTARPGPRRPPVAITFSTSL